MRLIQLIIFSLLAIKTQAQTFIQQQDKHLHYTAGAAFGAVSYNYVWSKTKNKKKALASAIISSIALGVIKETIDHGKKNNEFDFEDLAATTLGGLSIGITIDLFNKKHK